MMTLDVFSGPTDSFMLKPANCEVARRWSPTTSHNFSCFAPNLWWPPLLGKVNTRNWHVGFQRRSFAVRLIFFQYVCVMSHELQQDKHFSYHFFGFLFSWSHLIYCSSQNFILKGKKAGLMWPCAFPLVRSNSSWIGLEGFWCDPNSSSTRQPSRWVRKKSCDAVMITMVTMIT